MKFDESIVYDAIRERTKELAETAEDKSSQFHESFDSKMIPQDGKFGDQFKYLSEMIPGFSEYSAIKEGDWKAFAIAAGIDVAAITMAVAAAGGGQTLVNEITDFNPADAFKELLEVDPKQLLKMALKEARDIAEIQIDDLHNKDGFELLSIVYKNKLEGKIREDAVAYALLTFFERKNILREVLLCDKNGVPFKDSESGLARSISFVIVNGKKIIEAIDVISQTDSNNVEMQTEKNILNLAKEEGGAYIKNRYTDEYSEFVEGLSTQTWRV